MDPIPPHNDLAPGSPAPSSFGLDPEETNLAEIVPFDWDADQLNMRQAVQDSDLLIR
ncbi:MAG: hypothetical protein GY816_14365 [Cytophagales bacterium]|nr:hypothetical protein [Cytophagales bacterium]